MPVKPPTHKPVRHTASRHKVPEQERGNSAARGYGHRWRVSRAGYLLRHPLCVECEKIGRATIATDVDHIIPHRGNKDLFWDVSNWNGLCSYHHKVKTGKGL